MTAICSKTKLSCYILGSKGQDPSEDSTTEVELAHSCFIKAHLNINRHSPTPALWRPINLDVYLRGTEQEPKEQCSAAVGVLWVSAPTAPLYDN